MVLNYDFIFVKLFDTNRLANPPNFSFYVFKMFKETLLFKIHVLSHFLEIIIKFGGLANTFATTLNFGE